MCDQIINDKPLREQYAISFRKVFSEKFNVEGVEEFSMSVKDFDNFIYMEGFTESEAFDGHTPRMPRKGDDVWAKFRNESNSIRSELNIASVYGEHGEPPYRIDYVSGVMVVRFMKSVFRVTAQQMASKILSLAENKSTSYQKMHNYLIDNANALPPELQGRVGAQKMLFNATIRRIRRDLTDYMETMEEVYDEAVLRIEGKG